MVRDVQDVLQRMLARTVLVIDPGLDRLSAKEIQKTPEVQGLLLANDIFEGDTPLKELAQEEWLLKRKERVAPRVDKFFSFIHSFNEEMLARSEKLQEAAKYGSTTRPQDIWQRRDLIEIITNRGGSTGERTVLPVCCRAYIYLTFRLLGKKVIGKLEIRCILMNFVV